MNAKFKQILACNHHRGQKTITNHKGYDAWKPFEDGKRAFLC